MTKARGITSADIYKSAALIFIVVGLIRDPSWVQWAQNLSTTLAYRIAYEHGSWAEPQRVFETVQMVVTVLAFVIGLSLLYSALRILRTLWRVGRSPTLAPPAEDRPAMQAPEKRAAGARTPPSQPRAPQKRAQAERPTGKEPTVSPHAPMNDSWFPRFILIAVLLFIAARLWQWGVPWR
jgi:hypothetical protein